MSINRDETVRSRKPRRCWGCREVIPAGVPHHASTSIGSDGIGTVHTCMACDAYWRSPELAKYVKDNGMLWEDFEEGDIGKLRKGGEI